MAKFLIEVPHGADKKACYQAIEIFLKTGSHFLTHADWGCLDGDHKAWIIAEVDTKEDAMYIVPPAFRSRAKIVKLTTFNGRDLVKADNYHNG